MPLHLHKYPVVPGSARISIPWAIRPSRSRSVPHRSLSQCSRYRAYRPGAIDASASQSVRLGRIVCTAGLQMPLVGRPFSGMSERSGPSPSIGRARVTRDVAPYASMSEDWRGVRPRCAHWAEEGRICSIYLCSMLFQLMRTSIFFNCYQSFRWHIYVSFVSSKFKFFYMYSEKYNCLHKNQHFTQTAQYNYA